MLQDFKLFYKTTEVHMKRTRDMQMDSQLGFPVSQKKGSLKGNKAHMPKPQALLIRHILVGTAWLDTALILWKSWFKPSQLREKSTRFKHSSFVTMEILFEQEKIKIWRGQDPSSWESSDRARVVAQRLHLLTEH